MQGNNLLKLAFALRRTTHCVFPWAENVIRAGVIYLSLICGAIWANYKTGHLWFVGIVYINKDPKEIGWFAFSMHSLETIIAKNWYIFGEPWQVRGWTPHVFSKAKWWESLSRWQGQQVGLWSSFSASTAELGRGWKPCGRTSKLHQLIVLPLPLVHQGVNGAISFGRKVEWPLNW